MARVDKSNHGFGYPKGDGVWDKRANGMRLRFYIGVDPRTNKKKYSRGIILPIDTPYTKSGNRLSDVARAAVESLRHELITEYEEQWMPLDIADKDMTVEQYALGWNKRRIADPNVKEATIERNVTVLNTALKYFGHLRLQDVRVRLIRDTYTKAIAEDGLTTCKLEKLHGLLSMMFDEAEADELIPSNPFRNRTIKAKKHRRKSPEPLTIDEAKRLLACPFYEDEESRFMGLVLALKGALRRGEFLGLTWKNVYLGKNPYIRVTQQLVKKSRGFEPPKAESYRTYYIDDDLRDLLIAWKETQAQWLLKTESERLFGRKKRDLARAQRGEPPIFPGYPLLQSDRMNVVTDQLGEPHDPNNYEAWARRFFCRNGFGAMYDEDGNAHVERFNENGFPVDENGKPYSRLNPKPRIKLHYEGLTLHALRHTSITVQLSQGIDLVTCRDRAGHSSVETTNIYAHSVEENLIAAAKVTGRAFAADAKK